MRAVSTARCIAPTLLLTGALLGTSALHAASGIRLPSDTASKVRFEQNVGQFDSAFDAAVRRGDSTVLISSSRIYVRMNNVANKRSADVEMQLCGANPAAKAEFENRLPLSTTYFLGNDPDHWHAGVAHYGRVRFREVYPGVDLVYYDKGHQLEYDFIVAPGVDPSAIELTFSGVTDIEFGERGDLLLETAAGDLIVSMPFVYQDFDGEKRQVAAAFEPRGAQGAGFSLGAYDRTRPLIIDPGLEMGTFVGGSGFDNVLGVAALGDDIWVVGQTNSPDFPAPGGADPPTIAGDLDLFVAEYVPVQGKDGDFSRVIRNLVFIGGSGRETPTTINIDDEGLIHLVGTTGSTDFPVTPDATQGAYGGGALDMFFMVLRPGTAAGLSAEEVEGPIFAPPEMDFADWLGGDGTDDTTAAGQTLNVVTQSGGNEFSGSCTFFFGITDSTTFPHTAGGQRRTARSHGRHDQCLLQEQA